MVAVQDLDFDAAVPMYVNRRYFVEFLHTRVFEPKHSNILEDFLYVTFRSLQFIAMTRANALIDVMISRPLRWLSGKSHELQDWSPFSMGEALDLVEQFFVVAQHDGSRFFDSEVDIFRPIADKQPAFAAWRTFTFEMETVLAADRVTKHRVWELARRELISPADATNAATQAKTIEYLEVQCAAGLRKMHDRKLALCDKLTSMDGENSVGRSEQAHDDTIGCHATNDALAESVFGTYDMLLRRCPGISMEAASGVSQAVRSMMLSMGDHVARRKESRRAVQKTCAGWFYTLPEREQEALVELSRTTVKEMRDIDRGEHHALDEYNQARRKTNVEHELDALLTRYALAMSFFERWCKRGVASVGEISTALAGYGDRTQAMHLYGLASPSHSLLVLSWSLTACVCVYDALQDQLDWLREQIEMRCVGLSWTDWETPWSSSADEYVGTVAQLREHLKAVLVEEHSLEARGLLPSKDRALVDAQSLKAECPAPQMRRKTFRALGTPTVQADALSCERTTLSADELATRAELRRTELEVAGEIDWVCDRQPFQTGQVCACASV